MNVLCNPTHLMLNRFSRLTLAAILLIALLFGTRGVTPAYAATLTVTNTNDSGAGSLRQAILSATPGDTITFVPALAGQTITLVSGFLNLNKPLTIDGSSLASPVIVNGNNAMNIFYITASGTFTLKGLDIINGYASSTGVGGGIYVGAGGTTINVNTVRLSGNRAPGGNGGALYIPGGGITVNVTNSAFLDNGKGPGSTYGGAIYNNGGVLNVTNSTFSGNSVGFTSLGGAIYNAGTAAVTNSTFSGNVSNGFPGAAIYNAGQIYLTNSTLSGNIGYGAFYNASFAVVHNSILANTVSGPDCTGNGFAVNTNNLIETQSGCSAPLIYADPNLGPLANNGGSTQTFALLAGSPALNTGNNAICAAAPTNNLDQRGVTRPQGAACDIGAYEMTVHPLTIASSGTGSGVITPTMGVYTYTYGTVVTVTASADTGSTFTGWSGACGGNGVCGVTMTAATNVTGTFTLNTYTITPTAGANGAIIPDTPQVVNYGDSITFTIAANTGYHIADVGVDDVSQGAIDSYTFNNVTASHTLTAAFAIDAFVITPTAGTNGAIIPDMPQVVNYGDSITFTIAANTGYHIADMGVDGASQGAIDSYTFDNVTADHTITASFALNTYTLTVATDGNGNGGVTPTVGTHPYLYGDVVTLAASASTGSTFTGWSGDADCVDSSVTMDADKACTATFTLKTYTLTVATDGTGSGVVTPTVGTHPYLYGDPVSLAASANAGSTFAGWSGDADCVDSSVTMDADKVCTAAFTLNAPASLSAINDGPTALGSVTTLTATIMDGINVTYAWNFGDGSLGAGATVTHTYAAAGTYPAIVTATNSAGSLAATTTVYVTTNPSAHAGSDQTVHTGRSVTLDGSASFDSGNFLPLTYHWQQTGGSAVTLSGASNMTATFAAPVITQTKVLTFELTVTNTQSIVSLPDVVVITIEPYRVMLPLVLR